MSKQKEQTTMERQEERDCLDSLKAQSKVRVMLPRIPGDTANLPQEVFLNGVPYFIPRGMGVEVPEDIAQVLVHAGLV